MKKVYEKPNMEVVSFASETVATDATPSSLAENSQPIQTTFTTITY